MRRDRRSGPSGSSNAKRMPSATLRAEKEPELLQINAARSREWMPAQELWQTVRSALALEADLSVNLDTIDYLDASALQILLALDAEQKRRGRMLQLVNASANLRHWFEYAGAAGHLSMAEKSSNE